jgi:hypothetical protein
MKATLLFALLSLTIFCRAQVTHVWVGGNPQHRNDWNCPENWSTHQVPGPGANVLIPENRSNPGSYPVISTPSCMVNSLSINPGATITITSKGSLTILNPDYCEDVSRIKVYGRLDLPGTSVEPSPVVVFATFRPF